MPSPGRLLIGALAVYAQVPTVQPTSGATGQPTPRHYTPRPTDTLRPTCSPTVVPTTSSPTFSPTHSPATRSPTTHNPTSPTTAAPTVVSTVLPTLAPSSTSSTMAPTLVPVTNEGDELDPASAAAIAVVTFWLCKPV